METAQTEDPIIITTSIAMPKLTNYLLCEIPILYGIKFGMKIFSLGNLLSSIVTTDYL